LLRHDENKVLELFSTDDGKALYQTVKAALEAKRGTTGELSQFDVEGLIEYVISESTAKAISIQDNAALTLL
jgi:hypothetical protein